MKKFILLILIVSSLQTLAQVRVTQQRLAIDTVTAIKMLNQEIAQLNNPVEQKIAKLELAIELLHTNIRLEDSKINRLKDLEPLAGTKTKDEGLKSAMTDLIMETFRVTPEDTLLAHLATPKDLEMARKKGEVNKLLDKEWNKFLKKVSKGDFTHPFLKHAIGGFIDDALNESRRLSREKRSRERQLTEAKGKIVPEVTQFDADMFLAHTGSDQPIPTRFITETVTCKYRQEGEDYDALVAQYYNTPNKLNDFKESKQVTGKFDGYLEDTLGMFPLGSSKYAVDNEYYTDAILYDKILIKSKNNTVKPLILSRKELVDGKYLENDDVFFLYQPEWTLLGHGINKIDEVWEKDKQPKDGIDLSFHPDGATINVDFTYIYNGGCWTRKIPYSPEYMVYNDLLKYSLINPVDFYYNNSLFEPEIQRTKIIVIPSDQLGAMHLPEEKQRLYFKSQNIDDNFDTSDGDFSISKESLLGCGLFRKLTSLGDAWIAVYADVKNGNPYDAKIEVYQIYGDCFDCFSVYNGITTGEKVKKVAVGTLFNGAKQWKIMTSSDEIDPEEYGSDSTTYYYDLSDIFIEIYDRVIKDSSKRDKNQIQIWDWSNF